MVDVWITTLLSHIFQNTAMAGIGDEDGLLPSASAGYFYIGLHTNDPKEFSAEVDYEGYTRVAIPRSAEGFTVVANRASNYGDVQFPDRTDDGDGITATYFGIHTELSGSGNLFASERLAVPLTITQGELPPYGAGNLIVEFTRL